MSALEDIGRAVARLKAPPKGAERAILVGNSAERSIRCDPEFVIGLPDKLGGLFVQRTTEFEGWAIRDCLKSGEWVDAK